MKISYMHPFLGLVLFDLIFPSLVFVIILLFITNGNTTFVFIPFSKVSNIFGNNFARFLV